MEIRVLAASDAAAYQVVRLRALREHPEAYGSSFEEEQRSPIEEIAERLRDSTSEQFRLGAFIEGRLVGIAGFFCFGHLKTRHRGVIWGMYVTPEARRQRVGTALIEELIRRVRDLPHLDEIVLAVTVGNAPARALYLAAGFEASHTEPRYLKLDGRYYDMEWMRCPLR